jgi:hypothetical protein
MPPKIRPRISFINLVREHSIQKVVEGVWLVPERAFSQNFKCRVVKVIEGGEKPIRRAKSFSDTSKPKKSGCRNTKVMRRISASTVAPHTSLPGVTRRAKILNF